ncbi:MAG: DUF1653 domain-containing protein [Sulfurovum sp.]|nr:MAG: DUF1653 domain-containing protein [Sulfurovum sp.]
MELKKGLYRHYKGNMYEVYMTAQHSETEEWMVVYQALYGEKGMWVRPYEIFIENVELKNGKIVKRFQKVEDEV